MMARTALLAAVLTGAAISHGTEALSVGTAFLREPRFESLHDESLPALVPKD